MKVSYLHHQTHNHQLGEKASDLQELSHRETAQSTRKGQDSYSVWSREWKETGRTPLELKI